MNSKRILIVDDDLSLLRVMEHNLSEGGFAVTTTSNAIEALELQHKEAFPIIFTDIKMPKMNGVEFISTLREFDSDAIIIVLTGFPTIDMAVSSMKSGAFDFIQKPIDKEHLLSITQKACDYFELKNENRRLKELVSDHLEFGNMIGKSTAMQNLYNQARQAASSNATIMINGETGTGKEMLAKAIHYNSNRKDKPFLTINCAAIPANLLESQLFGHKKGTFTGAISDRTGMIELADEGTFFLDEIGDLSLELQPKLLRVLQEREIQPLGTSDIKKVDIRFIVATHKDLLELVKNGDFREDLYYRLNIIPLTIPPLRMRNEDTISLFTHFLKESCESEGRSRPNINSEVIKLLENYSWPGNVREVQNLAQRLAVLVPTDEIGASHLPDNITSKVVKDSSTFLEIPNEGIDMEEWIDKLILEALKKNEWNQSKTAKFLNISRNTLVYRLDKRPLLIEAKKKLN